MPESTSRERFAALTKRIESRYNIATKDRAADLHIYGAIGGWWSGVDAEALVPEIRALDVDTINVYINSPGGNVYDGIAIRNALRSHSARIVVTVDAIAASAASFIACAGDEVIMAENSELMIHEAWGYAIGDASDMRAAGDDLDRISANISAMYAAKAGGDAADWRDRMKAETWYSAQEAVDAGLADRLDTTTEDDDTDASNLFDLSMYAHAGRAAASAPIPVAAMASPRKENTMPEITRDDLDQALKDHADAQSRVLETRLAGLGSATPDRGPQFASFGHFIKALAAGDDQAQAFLERQAAYTGSTTADDEQPNTWVRDAIHLLRRQRKVMNEFSILPLPESGMTLEYLQLNTNSIAVAKQAAEGDNLVKGKISLKSDTTPVETYGGWTEWTKQQIERGSEAYLSTGYTAMNLEYARATEQVVRDLLLGIIETKLEGAPELSIAANATAYDWLDLIVDAAGLFDDLSFNLDGGYVSKDVFKKLIRLEDTNGNSLMRVWGTGTNQVGELDLREVKGDLASVQFKLLPSAPDNTLEFHDRLGITTWESPGAPRRLQDQNIVNLTEAVSQYGYLAAASQFPDAIQAVEITPAA
ncbi:head maturation protease, ClpP-related [Microbacterium dauci]|uniref:ATP-dependent Clp protease proteolytic subunit n=1 Tax=Microbacterium dauci TaxID=3048008 RepID=A0ABT6ZGR1_9MICO|nr:head maturation protease, ClpP-related [Microbacterium sp. LX3-4]MDJ1115340.1 ATP-dependent Clp protease proteolytic subunit [Microbacterium sp. LX3-4]